jgi:hypothetical protein
MKPWRTSVCVDKNKKKPLLHSTIMLHLREKSTGGILRTDVLSDLETNIRWREIIAKQIRKKGSGSQFTSVSQRKQSPIPNSPSLLSGYRPTADRRNRRRERWGPYWRGGDSEDLRGGVSGQMPRCGAAWRARLGDFFWAAAVGSSGLAW